MGAEIRYGVVGALGMGGTHIRAIKKKSGSRLAAVCDIRPDNVEQCLNKHFQGDEERPAGYVDLGQMLENEKLDAVVVATPNHAHVSDAIACLDAGVHVLCEKPLATNVADCDRIIAAAEKNDRVLQVGFLLRAAPPFRRMQELVAAGDLGRPVFMWSHEFRGDWRWMSYYADEERYWRRSQARSGGSLVEKNCHDFDLFNMVAGSRPMEVSAKGGNAVYHDRDTIDYAVVRVDYEDGFHAMLNLSLFVPHGFRNRYLGVIGTEGSLELRAADAEVTLYQRESPDVVRYTAPTADDGHFTDVCAEHEWFAEAIRQGKAVINGGDAARSAVAIAEAAEQSVRSGHPVAVDNP